MSGKFTHSKHISRFLRCIQHIRLNAVCRYPVFTNTWLHVERDIKLYFFDIPNVWNRDYCNVSFESLLSTIKWLHFLICQVIMDIDAWTAPTHYLKQCWIIVNWTLRNKLQWNFNRNSNIFIQENALEHVVCEMASILSRPQCVNVTKRAF